jgi:CheY-like chemotaxis protein
LVDDDSMSQRRNQGWLEQQGFVVLQAQDEGNALEQARQSTPSVIFVHLVTNVRGNLGLLEALKADDGCRHIRVVVIPDRPNIKVGQATLHTVQHEGW